MLYQFLAKKIQWQRLEVYAASRGIRRQMTPSYDDFGELHWEQEGRAVRVRICYDNPSSGPLISLNLKSGTEFLDLRTYRPMTRPSEGWEEFTSPSPAFNLMYRTRHVKSGYREMLLDSPWIFDEIVKFYEKWMFILSNDIGMNGLVIDGYALTCVFGPSMIASIFPYISPERIESILPDMIELAEKFDSVFQ